MKVRLQIVNAVLKCNGISTARTFIRQLSSPTCELLPPETQTYEAAYKQSIEDPDSFWSAEANRLHWHKRWKKIVDNSNPPFTKWLVL
jgi:acetyl-CoA synthetase